MTSERAPSARAGLESEYEIVRELGLGGTAIVYLARKRSTGAEVAIKLIRAAYLEDEEALARFAREARFASRLDHPNVVPIREVLPLGAGGVALIMAHVSGRTLKQYIRDEGALPAERAERVLRDVASGLGAAHAMDIIHRDVKPENIFIEESGRALLADFGLARSVNGGDTQLTMSGVAIGTPTYMPPEQIDGGAIDARGDIYSLGLVAWEMLSGRRPWDGHSLYALLYHQKHDYLPGIREIRPDLTDDRLANVIATAIEKDPAARWQSVSEMMAALDGVVPARHAGLRPEIGTDTIRVPRGGLPPVVPVVPGKPVLSVESSTPISGVVPISSRQPAAEIAQPTNQGFIPIVPPERLPEPGLELDEEPQPRRRFVPLIAAAILLLLIGGSVVGLHSWLANNDVRAKTAAVASSKLDSAGGAAATTPANAPAAIASAATPDSIVRRRADSVAAFAAAARADSIAAAKTAVAAIADTRRTAPLSPAAPNGRTVGAPSRVAAQPPARVATAPVVPPAAPAATPTPAPATPARRSTIVAGGMHTCLVGTDGHGYCWGANTRGQLGANTTTRTVTPIAIGGGLELTTVAAGLSHSCALARGGAAWCWGEDDHGQLGDGSNGSHTAPVHVATTHVFRAITAGASHSCALDTDGVAWCWGAGSHGQLGNGSTRDANAPVAASGQRFTTIAAGWNFTCALDAGGHAACWGENDAGQLGTRDTTDRAQPTPVAGDLAFVAIAAGNGHACGVTAQGDAYCWGRNSSGQLGDGTTTSHLAPSRVKSDAHFVSITAGAVHTCAVDNGGQAFCWGLNSYGQLGDGGSGNQVQPVRVAGGREFTSVRAFGSHTCGTTVSGDAFCWGYNLEGQLGDGTRVNRSRPVYLEPPAGR